MSNSFNDHTLLFHPELHAIIARAKPEMPSQRT